MANVSLCTDCLPAHRQDSNYKPYPTDLAYAHISQLILLMSSTSQHCLWFAFIISDIISMDSSTSMSPWRSDWGLKCSRLLMTREMLTQMPRSPSLQMSLWLAPKLISLGQLKCKLWSVTSYLTVVTMAAAVGGCKLDTSEGPFTVCFITPSSSLFYNQSVLSQSWPS